MRARASNADSDAGVGSRTIPENLIVPMAMIWAGLGMIFAKRLPLWFPAVNAVIDFLPLVLIMGGGAIWVMLLRKSKKCQMQERRPG
jgi:hypothetical protein